MSKVLRFVFSLLWLSLTAGRIAAASDTASASQQHRAEIARVEESITRPQVVEGRDLRFSHLSRLQGLSQTRVAQMVQDDDGFVWFGTQQGLNRYDGYQFKIFSHEPDNARSLSGVFVYALFKDRAGVIWVGTDDSLDRYDRATETFTHIRLGPNNPFVIHISQDASGMLWLATNEGLYRLDPTSSKITRFTHDASRSDSLPSDDIKSSGIDRSGNLWIASSVGLSQFDPQSNRVLFHVPLAVSVREFTFLEDRTGTFWIASGSGDGLAVLDRKHGVLRRYSFNPKSNVDSGLTGVYALLEDHDGNVWIATMGSGLIKFDHQREVFVGYRNKFGDPESLEENRVISLMQDREGNIWAGLHAIAPNVFSPRPPPFEKFQPALEIKDGNRENLVNAIFEDSRANLWMGTGGALYRLDRRTAEYTAFKPKGPSSSFEVLSIVEDSQGILWLGTLGQGVMSFDPTTLKFGTSYQHEAGRSDDLSHNIVPRVFLDHAGTLWATSWNGLNRIDRRTGHIDIFKRDPSSAVEIYFELAEDPSGDLWVGSATGLYRFNPRDGKFVNFGHDPDDPSSLSNNTLSSVFVDSNHDVWAGTLNGLNRLDRATGRFKKFYMRDGLPGNAASCLLEDGNKHLWVSTNNGISKLDLHTEEFRNYSRSDGIPGADLTAWGACSRGSSGELFFAGFAGATAFHPELVAESTYAPPIVLTNFTVGGKPVTPGVDSVLKQSLLMTREVVLNDDQNNFSIAFSALSYSSPTTSRYRYKLDGLDKAWHTTSSDERTAGFTTLPAGSYVFNVQGATSRGPWSDPGASLRIVVLPPWWRTWWFRTLCGAAVVLVITLSYMYRLRQVKRMFEGLIEVRVEERNRIARELHDTLLQGFQALLYQIQAARNFLPAAPDRAIQMLDTSLSRATNVLREGRDAVLALRSRVQDGNDLVRTISALKEELAPSGVTEGGTTFKVTSMGTLQPINPHLHDEIYRIAREAVRNAYRYAQATTIDVELNYGQSLTLKVRDDGIGMPAEAAEQARSRGHWGLQGMKERAHCFGGVLRVSSQRSVGTEIELTIPGALAYQIDTEET